MAWQEAATDLDDLDRTAAQRLGCPPRLVDFGAQVPAFPGHQPSTRGDQGESQLHELTKSSHRPRKDCRPAFAMVAVRGKGFRTGRGDLDLVLLERGHDGLEERRLLADRFDEKRPPGGQGDREWHPGKATTAAEIDEGIYRPGTDRLERRQAVDHVEARDIGRFADGRQVDRAIPGEQEPDVIVDRRACVVRECEPEGGQTLIEGAPIGVRELREVLDTRRERFSLTAQALLLWEVPAAVRESRPRRGISRTAGWVGLP
jgi:hypothetical protein